MRHQMLLFVKKRFLSMIHAGNKTVEIRVGKKYAHVQVGHTLSLNGATSVTVTRVQKFDCIDDLLAGVDPSESGMTSAELRSGFHACYGESIEPPIYVFKFDPPPAPPVVQFSLFTL